MTFASSVDYLSMEGLPWVLMAWAGLYFFRPFATLVHELGHFWNAFILTSDSVMLTVGKPDSPTLYQGKRVRIKLSFGKSFGGNTSYSDKGLGLFSKILIISGGPFFSLGMSCLTGWLTLSSEHPVWLEITGVSWFCANSLTFIKAVLPMRLRPTEQFPDGPPSDGLQLLWLLSGKDGGGKREEN